MISPADTLASEAEIEQDAWQNVDDAIEAWLEAREAYLLQPDGNKSYGLIEGHLADVGRSFLIALGLPAGGWAAKRLPAPEPTPPPAPSVSLRKPISSKVRWQIFQHDGYACVECGSNQDLTIDHRLPISRGGSNDPSNLQTLCRSCNSRKGAWA